MRASKYCRIISVAIAHLAMTVCVTGCGAFDTFYWNVPLGYPLQNQKVDIPSPSNAGDNATPEEICGAIRQGAYNHRNVDSVSGIVLILGGAIATVVGTGLAIRSGHTDEWTGEWGIAAASGAAAVAAGVYLMTRAGEDRAVYWIGNGAVAQIRADRSQNAVVPGEYKSALDYATKTKAAANRDAEAAAQAEEDAKNADLLVAVFQQYDLKASSADVTAAPPGKGEAKGKPDAVKLPKLPTWPGGFADTAGALKSASELHRSASGATATAATSANTAALAATALAAEQAAWSDCAKALSAISGPDAAASAALAGAAGAASGLSIKPSSSSSGSSK